LNSKDSFLVKEALKGDKNAFRKLVDRYKIPVYNLAYRMIGNYAEAEDAAQETFLRVYKNLNRFKIEFKFSTWLFQIYINICKNVNKQKYRHKVVSSFSESNSPDQTLEQKMMDKSLPQIEDILEKKGETTLTGGGKRTTSQICNGYCVEILGRVFLQGNIPDSECFYIHYKDLSLSSKRNAQR